ncbi:hypothetical protein Pmani_007031 [Petrolisthes manimaculis]|uniref:EMC1 first beta-propeller domain-containing protein n=1 Tax=Petrolisthes manimaculis TaxID=1843537 RepID=A0AAE1UL61_9EUCA|nr:hypothetical protein Pmani_007031 [Petrolisthes manimaculis]KAK4322234.1 hypothetical protein Pmani_007031 [Petrolisthes manimaculis]
MLVGLAASGTANGFIAAVGTVCQAVRELVVGDTLAAVASKLSVRLNTEPKSDARITQHNSAQLVKVHSQLVQLASSVPSQQSILPSHFAVTGKHDVLLPHWNFPGPHPGTHTVAVFDESTVPRHIIVATSDNVLAALATKNGDIVWRQVLESGENGRVEALVGEGQRVTSVAGRMVRTWDTLTAALIHKTYLSHTPHPGLLERAVVVGESELVLGEVVVTTLDRVSGSPLDHTNVVAPWISTDTKCGSAGKSVGCVELSLSLIFVLLLTAGLGLTRGTRTRLTGLPTDCTWST